MKFWRPYIWNDSPFRLNNVANDCKRPKQMIFFLFLSACWIASLGSVASEGLGDVAD